MHKKTHFKELRVRIPATVFRKYQAHCIRNELSLPKQTEQLIRKFVEVMDENELITRNLEKKK